MGANVGRKVLTYALHISGYLTRTEVENPLHIYLLCIFIWSRNLKIVPNAKRAIEIVHVTSDICKAVQADGRGYKSTRRAPSWAAYPGADSRCEVDSDVESVVIAGGGVGGDGGEDREGKWWWMKT